MKAVSAYRCEHCGKVYLRAHSCKEHEEKRYNRNPQLRAFCYSCKFYEVSFSEYERENVAYQVYVDEENQPVFDTKSFRPNKCMHPLNHCKLYNNINISENLSRGLTAEGYKPMPNRKSGGCIFYKAIAEHPWAEIKTDENV